MVLHAQVMIGTLREQILSGHYAPGSRLPSIVALARRFGISAGMVRYGLAKLRDDGLITSVHGKGFFVADRLPEPHRRKQLMLALDFANSVNPVYTGMLNRVIHAEIGGEHILRDVPFLTPDEKSERIADAIMLSNALADDVTFRKWSEYSRRTGTPVLFFNRLPQYENLSYLAVDYRAESCRIIRQMLEHGARRICYYFQSASLDYLNPRLDGYRMAYAACGLPLREEWIIRDGEDDRFIRLLEHERMDVLYCSCHKAMMQAYRAMLIAGIAPGDGLPVFCFDNAESDAEELDLPISYIRMPLAKMARKAVRCMLERAADPTLPPVREQFEASVLVHHCDYLL